MLLSDIVAQKFGDLRQRQVGFRNVGQQFVQGLSLTVFSPQERQFTADHRQLHRNLTSVSHVILLVLISRVEVFVDDLPPTTHLRRRKSNVLPNLRRPADHRTLFESRVHLAVANGDLHGHMDQPVNDRGDQSGLMNVDADLNTPLVPCDSLHLVPLIPNGTVDRRVRVLR